MLQHVIQAAVFLGLACSALIPADRGPLFEDAPRDLAQILKPAHTEAVPLGFSIRPLTDFDRASIRLDRAAAIEGENDDDDDRSPPEDSAVRQTYQEFATSSTFARIRTRPGSSISLTRLRC